MIFRQILHPATGCASYIFGCTGKKALAVVDPHLKHVDDYLAVAAEAQSPIVAIVETHVQADHHSGALVLAERTGAPIYLHEAADVAFAHRSLHDGEEITLGNDYLRVVHTPDIALIVFACLQATGCVGKIPGSYSQAIPSLWGMLDAPI
ncbi:MAG TPA: MBL fold metallo-hydrolase [Ktedonobacterales bacterium]|nr:MBL fold metallo-hydrolase [Ktedonobacterales bacterium]